MRIASFFVMAFGILLLACAGYDEYRGITHAPSGRYTDYSNEPINKEAKPEEFHNAMIVHFTRSSLFFIAGVILFVIDRGQEKVDPMGPDRDENIDEELRQDDLDATTIKREANKAPEL
jgi:hypothetical protein